MFYFVTTCFCLLTFPAYAYTDPGTGILLIQGFVAAIALIIAFIKNPIKTAKLWWSFYFNKKKKRVGNTDIGEKTTKTLEDKDA